MSTLQTVKLSSRAIQISLVVAASGVLFCCVPAFSEPTTSPSAIAAARLKYRPPDNWIRHYLGDDRYKIAGNIWKFVSTTTDQYYHRPDSPFMLSQPADIVIGFASAREAEEAGYLPGPSVHAIVLPALKGNGANVTTINNTKLAMKIVLADGVSTVLLPPNWKRTRTGAQTVLGYALQSDTIEPLKGGGSLRFAFINAPGNVNIEPFLTAQKFPQLAALASRTNKNAAAAKYLENAAVSNAKLGGRSGVTLTPRTSTPSISGRMTVVARGAKVYLLENSAGRAANASVVINSFAPR
jgi:hypothetical protein